MTDTPSAPPPFRFHQGSAPLLISIPHGGVYLPPLLAERLSAEARAVPDTDWHLERLYAFAKDLGASVLAATHSRYVIDLNRPPDDIVMYAGANNTELCPTRFFDGTPLYRAGREPDAVERARRLKLYWQPYHAAIERELARLRALHGHALLWDGHSIESELPWLFEGRLPELNLGSNAAQSCSPAARAAVAAVLAAQRSYSQVVDGRFKGGYITRHYGRPAEGWQALQMEMVQAIYMLEDRQHPPPRPLQPAKVAQLQPLLQACLQAFLDAE